MQMTLIMQPERAGIPGVPDPPGGLRSVERRDAEAPGSPSVKPLTAASDL